MSNILKLAIHEDFVSYYSIFILLFFLCFAVHLKIREHRLNRKLQTLKYALPPSSNSITQDRTEFARGFDTYNKTAAETLGLPWDEFVEILIFSPTSEGVTLIRNVNEVSRYLNDSTIIIPNLPIAIYRVIPNVLTGLGILGTFLGLSAGVGEAASGLSSDTINQIKSSLTVLLHGAALAFTTSIVGMVLSMFFLFLNKAAMRRLHISLTQWTDSLESRLERITPESIAIKQLDEAKTIAHQVKKFNTELIASLEEALDEKIAGRISPQLDKLISTVNHLRSDRSTDSENVIGQAIERFTKALSSQAGSHFDKIATTAATISGALSGHSKSLKQTHEEVRTMFNESLETITKTMNTDTKSMTNTLRESLSEVTNTTQDILKSSTKDIANTSAQAAKEITGSISRITEVMAQLQDAAADNRRTLASMSKFMKKMETLGKTIENAYDNIDLVTSGLTEAAYDMKTAHSKTTKAINQVAGMIVGMRESITTMERHGNDVTAVWKEYTTRFEGIDKSLSNVFKQLESGLSRYTETVTEFVTTLDSETSTAIGNLLSAISELSQLVEDLTSDDQWDDE